MAKDLKISGLLDYYGAVLTQKQREMIEQYYDDDFSLAEIADNFGISRQGVRDAIKHGEATLLDMEEKVGFARRYGEIRQQLEALEKLAGDIRYYNATGYHTDARIDDAANRMLKTIRGLDEQEDV